MGNNMSKVSRWRRQEAAWRDQAQDYKTFIPVKEYCKKYFVSDQTVYRKIQARQIRAFFLNGRWFVKDYREGYSEPIRRD